jgi:dienelactone hydrolase
MRALQRTIALLILFAGLAGAQTQTAQVRKFLEAPLQTPDVVAFQLRQYLLKKVPKLPKASSAEQWTAEARRLRQDLLSNVIFRGWPQEWVNGPLRVEDLGVIPSGKGYRMRKLRYEIVPGFQSTAILYEPENLQGKMPAILNVNGHVGPPGKAVEYKQKRCINQARQGILSLNLEWLSFGELSHPENRHWFGAHLDLVGANAVGLFYLAMRKGLDYLYDHPNVDRSRIGVTGLSGGGWQTIVLSALDERVSVSIPVAGYSSLVARLERTGDIGDIEQNATDLLAGQDYPHLTAMRAPRPTLLIYNAEDDCCFRAPLVKEDIFDEVKAFFRLFGKESSLAWHENLDPSDHNYQIDNRLQSYRFFTRHFGLPVVETEIPVESEIKSFEELVVGLPKDNLTILGLARKLAGGIERQAIGSADGAVLRKTLRYQDAGLHHSWALANSKNRGLETRSYRFDFSNGLSADGVWFKAMTASEGGAATVILHDQGKKAAPAEVADRVNRGEQVLAVDLLFTGSSSPQNPGASAYTQMLATVGDRSLGIEAAQLITIVDWLRKASDAGKVRLESTGLRSQTVALAAAALNPGMFTEIVIRSGAQSLKQLLDEPIEYQAAPDLFCLDLYKLFDLESLAAMAAPTKVTRIEQGK